MTKNTKLLLIGLIFGCIVLVLCIKFLLPNPTSDFPKLLPEVTFKDKEGQIVNALDYQSGKVLFVFFNSTCDICHRKAKLFGQRQDRISNFDVVWISNEDPESIYQFSANFGFDQSKTHVFLRDTEGYSFTDFMVKLTPTLLFYQDGRLIEYFDNDTPIGYIIDQIGQNN